MGKSGSLSRGSRGISKLKKNKSNLENISKSEIVKYFPTTLRSLGGICRLCETKDGPFINVFDSDKDIAKKIEELNMPFVIEENDGLPHEVCFRCSTKTEELYEFINRSVNTQRKLSSGLGISKYVNKAKNYRTLWENYLTTQNTSNDSLCASAISKAVQNHKRLKSKTVNANSKKLTKTAKKQENCNNNHIHPLKDEHLDKAPVLCLQRCDESKQGSQNLEQLTNTNTESIKTNSFMCEDVSPILNKPSLNMKRKITEVNDTYTPTAKKIQLMSDLQPISKELEPITEIDKDDSKKPFNIMDHVSTIRIHNVGSLYQCKLCDRNFMIKSVLMSHSCAKTGVSVKKSTTNTNNIIRPEPPKVSKVKYINTKIDNNSASTSVLSANSQPPKPRIGPASKVKRNEEPTLIGTIIRNPSRVSINSPANNPKPRIGPASKINRNKEPNQNLKHGLLPGTTITIKTSASDSSFEHEPQPTPSTSQRPYPVGLIQSSTTSIRRIDKDPPIFCVPPEKQQAYKIVQTGNPSKLLISAVPKKTMPERPTQPYKVTIEEAEPPKNAQMFTFINCDPLLQPSYVLPTNHHAAPSHTKKDNDIRTYTCTMCNKNFNREQKLLVHIQSHYDKMDSESVPNTGKR